MAMEEILDSVRRIVHKWVNTSSRVQSNLSRGDTIINVKNARRFAPGDQVMLKNNTVYETGLIVAGLNIVTQCIKLETPILNDWSTDDNTVLIKTINEQFVQGIYIGDPDVIPKFPAITVNGISRSSEWWTLESTKERYEIEIGVFVQESTHEKGYRFLLKMADEIQKGLKYNIFPLVGDYDITSLAEDVPCGAVDIRINNRKLVEDYRRVILEDEYEYTENWVTKMYSVDEDPAQTAIRLKDIIPYAFSKDDTSVIIPRRFIFNSWPHSIQYGTIHKGELLKAAKISWFAEEEEMQQYRRFELTLK